SNLQTVRRNAKITTKRTIKKKATTIEEAPETVTVTQVKTETGDVKKVKTTKRVIKKKQGQKEGKTHDDQQPIVTVQTTETVSDEDTTDFTQTIEPQKATTIEEAPESFTVTQVKTETGDVKKVKTTKRVIKKKQGPKEEVTEITTVEKDGEAPITTFNVTEEEAPEEIKPVEIVELPEESTVEDIQSPDGKTKRKVTTKRTIKKKVGPKVETTVLTTETHDDQQPIVTVQTTETVSDEDTTDFTQNIEPQKATTIEEAPETVTVTQVKTETGDVKKVKTTKRVIKKKQGPKEEVTEITTVEKDGEAPITTFTVTEEETPEEIKPVEIVELQKNRRWKTSNLLTYTPLKMYLMKTHTDFTQTIEPQKATTIEEAPESVTVTQVKTETGDVKKVKTTKRVIKKKQGPKEEVTEITTVEKDGEAPITTFTVTRKKP
ncbi:unnamed protein product, partial [Plutella xylostella]